MSRVRKMILFGVFSTLTVGCASTSPDARQRAQTSHANPSQMVAVARLAERQGDTEKARSLFEKLIAMQQELPTAHHRLGVLAGKRGNLVLAEEHFAQSRAAGLDSIELQSDEAYNKMLAGDLDAADQSFQAILIREPKHKRTLNNLAVLRAKQGRFDEALLCSRGAVGSAKAYANVGYLFSQFGALSLAKENYHRALAKDPELRIAARALLQLRDMPEVPRQEGIEQEFTEPKLASRKTEQAITNEQAVALVSHETAATETLAEANETVDPSDPVAFYEAMQSQQHNE